VIPEHVVVAEPNCTGKPISAEHLDASNSWLSLISGCLVSSGGVVGASTSSLIYSTTEQQSCNCESNSIIIRGNLFDQLWFCHSESVLGQSGGDGESRMKGWQAHHT
jgi:hypothetical protein